MRAPPRRRGGVCRDCGKACRSGGGWWHFKNGQGAPVGEPPVWRPVRAELHGKPTHAEDGLTSAVFSALSWLPAVSGLRPMLSLAFPDFDFADVDEEARVVFWPKFYDGTEPDVVIISGDYAVLVEAKEHAGFGHRQLEREWAGLKQFAPARGRELFILAVTNDTTVPDQITVLRSGLEEPARCSWLSWTNIADVLREGQPDLPPTSQRLVDEVVAFLRHRGVLMEYTGISAEDNWLMASATRIAADRVYPQVAALAPAVLRELEPHGIVWGDPQWRISTGMSRSLEWSHQWGLRSFLLLFKDSARSPEGEDRLFVAFDLTRARMAVGTRHLWPGDAVSADKLLAVLKGDDSWRATVGAWDLAEHENDVPASAMTTELAERHAEFSSRRTGGKASLWVYRTRPLHDAPLQWIASTLVEARDLSRRLATEDVPTSAS